MIYIFRAVRLITAKIAIEAATTEEANDQIIALATMRSLQNNDFPSIEEEWITLHAAYETFEGARAAEGIVQLRQFEGDASQVKAFWNALSTSSVETHFEEEHEPTKEASYLSTLLGEPGLKALYRLGEASEWRYTRGSKRAMRKPDEEL